MGLIEGIIMGIVEFCGICGICSSVYSNNTGHDTTQAFQENMLIVMGISFLAHINYGAALGDMTTFLSRIKKV
jgi:hypothetical protein